jgi:hypothetical protein
MAAQEGDGMTEPRRRARRHSGARHSAQPQVDRTNKRTDQRSSLVEKSNLWDQSSKLSVTIGQ